MVTERESDIWGGSHIKKSTDVKNLLMCAASFGSTETTLMTEVKLALYRLG